jgi:hypothetical protein
MKLPQSFKEPTLPWTLVGMILIFLCLKWFIFDTTCPAENSLYKASPFGMHVAHSYQYGCGGATVGFTRNIDVDGITVFSTYGGGGQRGSEIKWLSETELQINYLGELVSIQTYEQKQGEVNIRLFRATGTTPISEEEIRKAREAAGY